MTLIPFYKMELGNEDVGELVSHSLNPSSKAFLEYSSSMSSTFFSSLDIHNSYKWQFYRVTQYPSVMPEFIKFSAFTSCPSPKLIAWNRFEKYFVRVYYACFLKADIGSAPDERIKMIGV